MLTTKNETGTKIILKKSELWIPELMLSIKTWILLDKVYGESLKSVSTTFFRNISNKLIKVAIKPKANTPKMDIPDFLIKDAISKLIDKYVTIYKSKSEKQRIKCSGILKAFVSLFPRMIKYGINEAKAMHAM